MPYEDSDPARDASAEPEPAGVDAPVAAVGLGPGDPAYTTRLAQRTLADADVVVGFDSVREYADPHLGPDTEWLGCSYDDQDATLAAFADRVAGGAAGAAAFTGDPNVSDYQFLGRVERAVDGPVRVVPGVSSVQVAASRARTPAEETTFVTLHKRGPVDADLDRLVRDAGDRHLAVLPRPYDWMPGDLAAHLVGAGAPAGLDALVFERLAREDERRTRTALGDLAAHAGGDGPEDTPFSDLSVLVVRRNEG